MDYDVIANLSFNFTFDSELSPEESMSMIFHEIIFSIVCLSGVIADSLIIYIIYRFKKMKTPTNIYIMNWLISDAVYLLLSPCFYRIFAALENLFIGEEIVCVSFELASVLQIMSITLIMVLCANWYLTLFTVRFGQFYKYVICLVWILALSEIISFASLCMQKHYTLFSHYMLFFSYAVLLCVVGAMHVTRYLTSSWDVHDKLKLNLMLITAYVMCWCPSWLCLLVDNVIESYYVLYYLSLSAACLGYLNAVVNFYIFVKVDKNFRMCLMQVFRYVHHDYSDVTQSFEESDDNFNHVHVNPINDNLFSDVYNVNHV